MKTLSISDPLKVEYCVPLWIRDENVRANTARIKARIEAAKEKRSEPIAVVCFGPSLNETWEKIREFKYVISCSGAHKFLVERGIIPTWHCEVDPRAHKVLLIGPPQKETQYLIASACAPALFDHLEGFNVMLWHIFSGEEEAMRVLPPEEWAVTGGSSVGLRAMTLARFLGFTEQHIFGMDGSYGASGKHAAEHPNQPKSDYELEYEGKKYLTTPSMLECAKQTAHELDMMPDVKPVFYGDGLVQALIKSYVPNPPEKHPPIAISKPATISAEYRDLNRKLHESNIYYGVGGGKHAESVLKLMDKLGTHSVLDYGCQPPDSKVLTPSGWKAIGDMNVGDEVIGSAGTAIRVTGVHRPGEADLFRVSFKDGTSLVVDGAHIWSVRTFNNQRRGEPFFEKKTRDLIGDLRWPNCAPLKWRIPLVKPVEFSEQKPRAVHPYLLGLLLGDGNISQRAVTLFSVREDIAAACEDVLPMAVGMVPNAGPRVRSWRLVNKPLGARVENPIRAAIREFGLWGARSWEKFIPERYLLAPPSDREALLQGLMDTDGEVGRHLSYSTTSEQLARDVVFLVQSLGGTAKYAQRKLSTFTFKGLRKVGRPSYVVHIKVPPRVTPCRVKKWTPPKEYLPNKVLCGIEPCGRGEVVGLSVDAPDQLYVTEHFLVTHNCGKGYLGKALAERGVPIWEYDPAIPGKDEPPRPADLVTCHDVLEHVEPDRIAFVLSDLKRVTRKFGFFIIHTGQSSKTLADGRNAHILQRDRQWWKSKLKKFFQVASVTESGPLLYVAVLPKAQAKAA